MKPILLHTEQLTVGYRKKALIPDITFSVQAGQILTLIGANGVGKSTILKSIARQLEPIAGTIFVGEQELSAISHRNLAKSMSILMTHSFQTEFLRCIDVVEAGRYPYTGQLGILSEQDHEKVAEALRLVHGEELAQKDFRKISDGQRQRILLAKAICQEAEILILDEPTSFLDVRYKLEFLTILKDLVREKQIAVILSLHELDLAQRISDVVLCIRNHTVDRIGTPDEIFTDAYITNLYGITCGSYESLYGTMELPAPTGTPQTIVIGGGGTGNAVYRQLQRENIPFYAGILQENDLDYPVAKALATEVVAEKAFEPIGKSAFQKASSLLQHCERVILCCTQFGTMNQKNQELVLLAEENGKQILEANS